VHNKMFMPAAGEVLIEFLFLYFGSARGTGRSFESRSRHKHRSLPAIFGRQCLHQILTIKENE